MSGKVEALSSEERPPRDVKGLQGGDIPLRWTKDGNLWILNTWSTNSAHIFKLNPDTGSRKLWKEIYVDSFSGIAFGVITTDGNTFIGTEYANSGSLRRVYRLQ